MKLKPQKIKVDYKSIIGVMTLAFLLWFMVKMNRVYDHSIEIPIKFVNLDSDKIFKVLPDQKVHVEFTGKGIDLFRISFYQIFYQIDLSGVPLHSEFDLSGHPEYVDLPAEFDISVKSIVRPREITLDLDRKVVQKLPVRVDYELLEPAHYILVDVSPKPDSIVVTGPAEMFKNVKEIFTEKKSFSEPSKAFVEVMKIQQLENYYALYEPNQVEVNFDIQRLAEKQVLDVPVTVINKPATLQVIPLPSMAVIYIKGGEKMLADLSADDFQIVIDFGKIWRPGLQKVKADLKTDANIVYMETRPPLFELIVQKKSSR